MKLAFGLAPALLFAGTAAAAPRKNAHRAVATTAQLDGSHWRITSIAGRPVRTTRPAELRFTADRVSGNAGCNSFGGTYRIVRGRLETMRIMSTKMACVDLNGNPVTAEDMVMSILTGPARVAVRGDAMTLSAAAGSVELRRIPD